MQRTKTKKKVKHKKGDRRYPKGEYPIYDHAYNQAIKNSPILNPSARHIGNSHWENPETALYILQGDASRDHFYKLGDEDWKPSLVLKAKAELKDVHERFENWAKEQLRTGKCLNKPTDWPQPFQELRLKKEALLDARLKEVLHIKKQQAEAKAKKVAERVANILPHGPLENMKDNSIDGQRISYSNDRPYIDEPHSPYHGMPLYWYQKMAKDWKEEHGLTDALLLDERNNLFEQERAEAMRKGLTPPTKSKPFRQFKKEKLAKITEKDFPDWPPEAKQINEIELV